MSVLLYFKANLLFFPKIQRSPNVDRHETSARSSKKLCVCKTGFTCFHNSRIQVGCYLGRNSLLLKLRKSWNLCSKHRDVCLEKGHHVVAESHSFTQGQIYLRIDIHSALTDARSLTN